MPKQRILHQLQQVYYPKCHQLRQALHFLMTPPFVHRVALVMHASDVQQLEVLAHGAADPLSRVALKRCLVWS